LPNKSKPLNEVSIEVDSNPLEELIADPSKSILNGKTENVAPLPQISQEEDFQEVISTKAVSQEDIPSPPPVQISPESSHSDSSTLHGAGHTTLSDVYRKAKARRLLPPTDKNE
jgi:hypothetical protein